ncbi:MAG: KilA-N domain-containing protein [Endomicrobium sp.]|jgi:hypothetical protein|nr:KilA-N domain-containing protein [Endomicrobium sp.]
MKQLQVQGVKFRKVLSGSQDYICISDIAKSFATQSDTAPEDLVKNWIRNKNTIEFLGVWEKINNINFNSVEFHLIKNEAGVNRFLMSVKLWAQRTRAIGLFAKTGRYNSGTFAHYDIALEFASWLSPELKLYIIKEFQRLKQIEAQRATLEWKTSRFLSKTNYKLQTDAIKTVLLPSIETDKKFYDYLVYAEEADLVNYALFGISSKLWKKKNPNRKKDENMRDFATPIELVILSNLEHKNAELIKKGISKVERFQILVRQANEEKKIFLGLNNAADALLVEDKKEDN